MHLANLVGLSLDACHSKHAYARAFWLCASNNSNNLYPVGLWNLLPLIIHHARPVAFPLPQRCTTPRGASCLRSLRSSSPRWVLTATTGGILRAQAGIVRDGGTGCSRAGRCGKAWAGAACAHGTCSRCLLACLFACSPARLPVCGQAVVRACMHAGIYLLPPRPLPAAFEPAAYGMSFQCYFCLPVCPSV